MREMTVIRHPMNKHLRLVVRGNCVRLKAPVGTFSYYHPNHIFTGFSWDAQTASLLFRRRPIESILILGLGGGTIARQCRMLYRGAVIIGVEIDPWVIQMAHDYFGLNSLNVEVVNSSADDYLDQCETKFDAIIDDVWCAESEESRAVLCNDGWLRRATRNLNFDGVYSANLWNRLSRHPQISEVGERLKHIFSVVREVHPTFGPTSVIAAAREMLTPREARSRMRKLPPAIRHGLKHVRFVTHDSKR